MTRLQPTITFGDDASAGADIAWQWLVSQRWPGWHVDVISVADPPPQASAQTPDLVPAGPGTHDSPLGRQAPSACGFDGIELRATTGDPRMVLSDVDAGGLLVIGARGRGLLKAMHIGSTAEWLLQCPLQPTVIARRGERVRSVVACVDGSRHSIAAVTTLAALPWLADTTVTVLAVRDGQADTARATALAEATLVPSGCEVETAVVDSDPTSVVTTVRHTLMSEVESRMPDLVAVGTAGLTGWERARVGSVAGTLAHHAPCSVLLAREAEDLS